MPRIKLLYALMISGVALCLLQIWWPAYYLTGDGPCHLYNARILSDIWRGHNTALFSSFYHTLYAPNPNWLSNIIMAGLFYFFSGPVTEKIFLSVYALTLISGFYKVIKHTSGSSSYIITVIFLFVFHHTLAKGFYNFSLGTALYFWMVWSWLRFLEKRNTINTLTFFILTALTFFAQLLPFVFGVITCTSLLLSHTLAQSNNKRPRIYDLLRGTMELAILVAPFIALMHWFTSKEGGAHIQLHHHFYRLIELVQFKYGITTSNSEELLVSIAGFTLITLLITAFIYRAVRQQPADRYDGFAYSIVVILLVYLFFPEDFMNRAILISMRAQLFILATAAIIAARILPQQVKNAGGLILFTCFAGLSVIRMQVMNSASTAVADYNFVSAYLQPGAVVLPLDFSPSGKDASGYIIADRNYLFSHALHYSGCERPIVFLDNYEANTGYFPLVWRYVVNPYVHLSTFQGIEGQPPSADIAHYTSVSGITIDNIVTWCYDSTALADPHYNSLHRYITAHYHLVYTSPTGRTSLYQRNQP